jgi:hypothetical protein
MSVKSIVSEKYKSLAKLIWVQIYIYIYIRFFPVKKKDEEEEEEERPEIVGVCYRSP